MYKGQWKSFLFSLLHSLSLLSFVFDQHSVAFLSLIAHAQNPSCIFLPCACQFFTFLNSILNNQCWLIDVLLDTLDKYLTAADSGSLCNPSFSPEPHLVQRSSIMSPTHAAIPGVALICSTVAFIIAICCLVAGTNPNTLEGMQLYTLNTSMAGPTLLKDLNLPAPNSSLNLNQIFGRSVLDDAKDKATDAANDAKSTAQGAAQSAKDTAGDAVDKAQQDLQAAADAVKNAAATIVSDFINATIETLDIQQFYVAHLLTYCEVS